MKLRNKKTGGHGDCQVISAGNLIRVRDCMSGESWQYDSLARFNEDWEDYKPSEPLIKDEKIRKAVRAWAEAVGVTEVGYKHESWGSIYYTTENPDECEYRIEFPKITPLLNGFYTITELCGEEE